MLKGQFLLSAHGSTSQPLGADGLHHSLCKADQLVLPRCHQHRIVGTAVLKELAAYYAPRKQSLIIECEHPAEAPEPAVARRRIGFYLRAGAHAAAMESRLFGVRYQIYSLPAGGLAKDEEIYRDLQELYRTMVPEPYYRGNVNFFGA